MLSTKNIMKPVMGPGIAPPAKTAAVAGIVLKAVDPVVFVSKGYYAKSPDGIRWGFIVRYRMIIFFLTRYSGQPLIHPFLGYLQLFLYGQVGVIQLQGVVSLA